MFLWLFKVHGSDSVSHLRVQHHRELCSGSGLFVKTSPLRYFSPNVWRGRSMTLGAERASVACTRVRLGKAAGFGGCSLCTKQGLVNGNGPGCAGGRAILAGAIGRVAHKGDPFRAPWSHPRHHADSGEDDRVNSCYSPTHDPFPFRAVMPFALAWHPVVGLWQPCGDRVGTVGSSTRYAWPRRSGRRSWVLGRACDACVSRAG